MMKSPQAKGTGGSVMEWFAQNWLIELLFFVAALPYVMFDGYRRIGTKDEEAKPPSPLVILAWLVIIASGFCLVCGGIHVLVAAIVSLMVPTPMTLY
jgi:amino acid transporter